MSKKKVIIFGLKTAQNPSLSAGLIRVFLEIIVGVSILMLILSPLFIWMYGFDLVQGVMIIIFILIIYFFIFYEPSKTKSKDSKFKIDSIESENIKKTYSEKTSCPNCGNEINKKAVRCKYCNYYFKEGLVKVKSNTKKSKSNYSYGGVDLTKQTKVDNKPKRVRCDVCNHGIDVDLGVCEYCGYEIGPMREIKK